jgi:hypothetical protein
MQSQKLLFLLYLEEELSVWRKASFYDKEPGLDAETRDPGRTLGN